MNNMEWMIEAYREFRHAYERFHKTGDISWGKRAQGAIYRVIKCAQGMSRELDKSVRYKKKDTVDYEKLDKLLNLNK